MPSTGGLGSNFAASVVSVVGRGCIVDFMVSDSATFDVDGVDDGLRLMFLDSETLAGSEICGVPEDLVSGILSCFSKAAKPGTARSSF